jgi:diguanylate cyclase (GGDEF)-like protein
MIVEAAVGPGVEAQNSANLFLPRLQYEILEAVATGEPLSAVMDFLCRRLEEFDPELICSVLTIDADNRVRSLAGPSLPERYSTAIDGIAVGPKSGSCGTAAWRREPVIVTDIETDPLWEDYKDLALPIGLRACWSTPIKSRDQRVIGTFAFYYRTKRGPTERDQAIVRACVHLCSIAIEHDTTQAVIHRLAFRDLVTGLPNRAHFQITATETVEAEVRSGRAIAIHYIDLDDFKGVNDTLGHRVGDLLLERVAARLTSCLAEREFVARLGGDEFAIVQPFSSIGMVRDRAECILAAFEEPFDVDGHAVTMGLSIGIAQAPDDGRDLEELLKNADMALYRAKSDGRGTYSFFVSEYYDRVQFRRSVERDLRKAVRNGEFELLYQPMVTLATGKLSGFEALIRWRHPSRGIVVPSDFIPLAEEMGLIGPVGEWVIREACAEAATWPEEVSIALNLSPLQFQRPGLVLKIAQTLTDTRLPPARLELEITETVILADNGPTRAALDSLRGLGVGISLDDFGTGYSSLRSLRAFPINKIKIDRSFVRDVCDNAESTAIVRTLIGLARDLGMKTTAEGVENEAQFRRLRSEGCTEAQGFYFSRPMSGPEVSAYFARPRRSEMTDTNPGSMLPNAPQETSRSRRSA